MISGGRDDPEHYKAALDMLRVCGYPEPERIAAATHVEMKVAAIMRHEQISEATVVINNVPCGSGRPESEYSCDKLLTRVLRSDQTMTVEGIDATTGHTIRKTYRGDSR